MSRPPRSGTAAVGLAHVEQYANNPIEVDHGQLKCRLRLMRGLQTDRTVQVIIAGHAFVQNLRRGHYDIELDTGQPTRLAEAFTETSTSRLSSPAKGVRRAR